MTYVAIIPISGQHSIVAVGRDCLQAARACLAACAAAHGATVADRFAADGVPVALLDDRTNTGAFDAADCQRVALYTGKTMTVPGSGLRQDGFGKRPVYALLQDGDFQFRIERTGAPAEGHIALGFDENLLGTTRNAAFVLGVLNGDPATLAETQGCSLRIDAVEGDEGMAHGIICDDDLIAITSDDELANTFADRARIEFAQTSALKP
jgi:hypothetical protein